MPTIKARKASDLASIVRAVREESGLSQTELAERIGLSREYVVNLETGQPTLYARRLFRIMHELGITVSLEYQDSARDDDGVTASNKRT
ncbi:MULTISPECIES: helix-turn-helix transcriptional regulator [unclassified Rathayibacter]|uniref:helix-turn-helix domain-containing protein n=1 Tax=unclassified Rathayibacter TaxID=2609250 RepID=UPI000F4C1381|nr:MULTISPECIES: helix-turn-helix transcriptional regulator [unclassified Rathayibacter]ROS21711.1 HTH-type transcriptional regulator/antitoxin HipB [Rathayibacter sp. PhB127]TCL83248.1 HTH-type transcriptional regulator/antitoxin HipB [Rathayibacter sp. PhB192]TCM28746.1 HTH-type transcriptional regulator/antitoxin HipB [Rathayibacter sp. PhB179]